MRLFTPTLPISHVRPRPAGGKRDVRLTILVSFAAGVLLGIPLTFGALFLGTLQTSSAPVVISPAQSSGHPAGTRFPARDVPKSGPATTASESFQHHGRRKVSPRPLGDIRTTWNFLRSPVSPTNSIREESGIVDGIFWTELAESHVPVGFGEESARQWREFLNATAVVKVEEGCGRMQNRLVTLSDGRMSCCRYRHNNDQIQGEIFSFYLGRLLGIGNLSPTALALVDPRTRRWSSAASQMALAGWSPERPAVLTQFVEGLQPAYVPRHLRDSKSRRLHPIPEQLRNLTAPEVSELVQWSDLVVFDYLTANLDRVVNNMYNERWNPGMMSQPTHNLAKTPDGLLLFLDNESGLLHGYRLLQKYEHFHGALLQALCLFRRRTVERVEELLRGGHVDGLLRSEFARRDPGMSEWLPFLPDRSIRTLKERLKRVMEQVRSCRARFESATDS